MTVLLLALQTLVAADAAHPSLALDPEGNPVVAFVRNGNIEVACSSDRGKSFGDPVTAIDAKGRARASNQRGPRVAVDAQKRVYVTAPVCFDEADLALGRPAPDLYLAVSTDRGKSFSKPLRINDQPKTARASLHWAAASPSGDLHVAWLDNRRGPTDLHLARISDHGKKIQKSQIAARDVCEGCAPGLALDSRGGPVLIFRDAAKKSRNVLWGSTKFARVNALETNLPACPLDAPAVALSPDGKTVALAWMDCRESADERNVYWTAGPAAQPPPEVVAHETKSAAQGHPSLAVEKDGTAWCAWEDARSGTQQIFAADWTTKKNLAVSRPDEGRAAFPSLAAAAGSVAVAYEAGESVAFRILATR